MYGVKWRNFKLVLVEQETCSIGREAAYFRPDQPCHRSAGAGTGRPPISLTPGLLHFNRILREFERVSIGNL